MGIGWQMVLELRWSLKFADDDHEHDVGDYEDDDDEGDEDDDDDEDDEGKT